jgi:nicotinamide-nucleotide amidase
VIVTLPGPPREMRPMWQEQVLPRLEARGLGEEVDVRTLRLMSIGESQVADQLGDALLRGANPEVATYARAEAVDVRIFARTEPPRDGAPGRTARALADDAEARVREVLGPHVWATGGTTWAQAIGEELTARGWTLATVEIGSGGALVGLLRESPWLRHAEVVAAPDDAADRAADVPDRSTGLDPNALAAADDEPEPGLLASAETARAGHRTDVGLAIRVRPRGEDTMVSVAVAWPGGTREVRRLAFRRGSQGHDRAAIASAVVLVETLRSRAASID